VELLKGVDMRSNRHIRLRPSPALVIASMALAVSLGGTGYAALKLPAKSVGAAQLKTNAVTSLKVKNASLLALDFKAGQLPAGPQGLKGDKGDKGDTGDLGPMGPRGGVGISGLERIQVQSANDSSSGKGVVAQCPSGKKVVGGGAYVSQATVGGPALVTSRPGPSLTYWSAVAVETSAYSGGWTLEGYALCANVAS
jgi:hypothetical protein